MRPSEGASNLLDAESRVRLLTKRTIGRLHIIALSAQLIALSAALIAPSAEPRMTTTTRTVVCTDYLITHPRVRERYSRARLYSSRHSINYQNDIQQVD